MLPRRKIPIQKIQTLTDENIDTPEDDEMIAEDVKMIAEDEMKSVVVPKRDSGITTTNRLNRPASTALRPRDRDSTALRQGIKPRARKQAVNQRQIQASGLKQNMVEVPISPKLMKVMPADVVPDEDEEEDEYYKIMYDFANNRK
jgi:hypothetical protein